MALKDSNKPISFFQIIFKHMEYAFRELNEILFIGPAVHHPHYRNKVNNITDKDVEIFNRAYKLWYHAPGRKAGDKFISPNKFEVQARIDMDNEQAEKT